MSSTTTRRLRPWHRARSGFTWRTPLMPALQAAMVLVWASGYLVGSIGVASVPPLTLTLWRFTLATVVLIAIAMVSRARWPRGVGIWARLIVSGVLMQTVFFSAGYLGLSLGVPAGVAALIAGVAPALVTVGASTFGERVRGLQFAGAALGIAGVLLAVSGRLHGAGTGIGLVFSAVSTLAFAVGTLWQKRAGASVDLRTGSAIQFGAATLIQIPLAALHGGVALPFDGPALASVAWIALVNSVVGMGLLFFLLRRSGSSQATSAFYLVAPVTALLGVPLLHQPIGLPVLVGMGLSLLGVALSGRALT